MIKEIKITINKEFKYPVSMLEMDNLMESALNLATKELNEELSKKLVLEEFFDIKIERPLVYKTKEVFKNELERKLYDWLFEQEVLEKWGTPTISFESLPFLYINGELSEKAILEIEKLENRAKKQLNKIKKRD